MKKSGVHQRRTRFIKEYLKDQNATRAAIAAGYSAKTAKQQGSRLLTKVDVREAVDQKNAEFNQKLDLTVERVKEEIARLSYYDPAAFWNKDGSAKPIHEIDENSRRAIAGFEVAELFEGSGEERNMVGYVKKFKLADKTRALEMAARHLKMLTDKIEISGLDAMAENIAKARKRAG